MTIVSKRRDASILWPHWGFYSRFLTIAFGRGPGHHVVVELGPLGLHL
jgi:hypothetical protein